MTQRTAGEIEGFIDMLRAAREDEEINSILQEILALPNPDRREMIRILVTDLKNKKAPDKLVEAIGCLVSDDIAEKASNVICRCVR